MSFLTAGLLIPLSASAQVVVTGQRTSTTLNAAPECTVNTCLEVEATGVIEQQLCLVSVLDGSDSMTDASTNFPAPSGPNRWERTFAALGIIVEAIGDGLADPSPDEFALIQFGNAAVSEIALTPDTAAFNSALAALSPPAGVQLTNTRSALSTANGVSCPAGSFGVILLASDGTPTLTNELPFVCPDNVTGFNECTNSAMAEGEAAKAAGWYVISVGLGLNPADPADALGIAVLDSIASDQVFNIPTPTEAQAVVDTLINQLQDIIASNIVVADTLTDCWSYVPGSTTGDLGALDPLTQLAPDGRQVVPYSIPTMANGDVREVCFDMAYDVATCGNVPAAVAFNSGNVVYDTGLGSDQTGDIPGSADVDMTTCQSVLPVELVDFAAVADERAVTLNWSTASELNNAGFEVEHALADSYFEMKGFVEGHGSTSQARNYTFTIRDLEPGSHLFRLKQVDYDGAFEYSPVVEVAVEVPDQYFLSEVYPNPFNPQAAVRFWVTRSQHVEVALHDIQGRQLMTLYEGVPASKASTLVRIDGSGLSSGTYLVRIQGEDFKDSRQVTLLK